MLPYADGWFNVIANSIAPGVLRPNPGNIGISGRAAISDPVIVDGTPGGAPVDPCMGGDQGVVGVGITNAIRPGGQPVSVRGIHTSVGGTVYKLG